MTPPLRLLAAALLAFAALLGPARAQGPAPVAVAAAADLRGVLEEVGEAFSKRHPGWRVQPSFAASGTLTAQVLNGAPYDVFLSADLGYPEQVAAKGLAGEGGVFPYAVGTLVLWVRSDLGADPAKGGLKVLQDPRIRRISIANPKVAPYGRAAEAALQGAGLLEALRPRLVLGENVAQAGQYLQTGAADAGLVSWAQAHAPALAGKGFLWSVPAGSHPPLRQGGLVLRGAPNPVGAAAFRAFLLGPEGQAVLARHGLGKP